MPRYNLAVLLHALAAMALPLASIWPHTGSAAETAAIASLTVIVVRHAEKVDDSRDPALSKAGSERAEALAAAVENAGLDAFYASQYQRTRLTAMPAAEAAGLPVRIEPIEDDIEAWAQAFAAELVEKHPGQSILVAGHSNTVPPLVAALCRCEVAPLADSDYDRIYILTMAEQGSQPPRFDLIGARYGSPDTHSPAKPPGEL